MIVQIPLSEQAHMGNLHNDICMDELLLKVTEVIFVP